MSRFIPDLVNEFLRNVKKNGYKDYKISTLTREGVWHQEYAIFQIDFHFPTFFGFDDSREYVSGPEFSEHAFWDDFCADLHKAIGECDIRWHSGTNEIEVLGKDYKQYYKEHLGAIEQLACDNDGYIVYKEENYAI